MSRRTVLGGAAALAIPAVTATPLDAADSKLILGRRDGRWLNAPKTWMVEPNGDLSIVTD